MVDKKLKSYSYDVSKLESFASARVEDVNASFKDLTEVCGRIRKKPTEWAVDFLGRAANMEIPIMYKRHNKRLGHRSELGGQRGRYPQKAVKIVLKALNSAIANAVQKSMSTDLIIAHASANKKHTYSRMASKGGLMKSDLETSRVEIIVTEKK